MSIREAEKKRILAIVEGIFKCILAAAGTAVCGLLAYLVICIAVKGDPLEDVIIPSCVDLIFIWAAVLTWKSAADAFKKAGQLKRYIEENKDKKIRFIQQAAMDRGTLITKMLVEAAACAFVMMWMIGVWSAGAWWFALLGSALLIVPGIMMVYDLKDMAQLQQEQQETSEEKERQEISPKANWRNILWTLLLGGLTVYNVIRNAEAFSHGIGERELPMFVVFNGLWILAIISQVANRIKKSNGR
jgi:hypothetical protein